MEIIDVIILTYNQATLLPKVLESVRMQEVDCKINIFVGNDCSSDDTEKVLEKYKEEITVVNNKKNLGASGNLAMLLMQCKGDYIAILEGDDYWVSNTKLQQQIDFLRANAGYYSCGCEVVGKKPTWIKKSRKLGLKQFNGQVLCYHTSTTFMRNPNLSSYDFLRETHRSISDRTLHGFLLSKGLAKRLDFYGVAYEPNDMDNLTATTYAKKPECYLTDLKILNQTYNIIIKNNAKPKNSKFFQTKMLLFGKIFIYYFRSKDKDKVCKFFKEMVEISGKRRIGWILLSPICVMQAILNKMYYRW